MEVKSARAVSIEEAKELLEARKKDGELGYEQSQALEHCEKTTQRSVKEATKIAEKVRKINENITEGTAVKITDISPASASTVRAIVSKDKIEMNDEEATKIVKEFE